MIDPSPLCTSSQSSSRLIDQCFFQELKNPLDSLPARILLEGEEGVAEGVAWTVVVVGDEVAIKTAALTAMDMAATAAATASTLRRRTSPRTPPHSLGRRTLRPSRDSEGMAPTEGRPFKIIIVIIKVSRAVAHPLEAPLPPAGCQQTVVALLVMEVLHLILTPLINPHMAVEAILVGTVAAVEGMVDRQMMATGARQAVAAMVAQEDKDRTVMVATGVMGTRMADRLVVAMVEVTVAGVTTTLREAVAEDTRVTNLFILSSLLMERAFYPQTYGYGTWAS